MSAVPPFGNMGLGILHPKRLARRGQRFCYDSVSPFVTLKMLFPAWGVIAAQRQNFACIFEDVYVLNAK